MMKTLFAMVWAIKLVHLQWKVGWGSNNLSLPLKIKSAHTNFISRNLSHKCTLMYTSTHIYTVINQDIVCNSGRVETTRGSVTVTGKLWNLHRCECCATVKQNAIAQFELMWERIFYIYIYNFI